MGEYAEMMTDGTMCETCGVFIGEPCGYPRQCRDCAKRIKKKKPPPNEKPAKKAKDRP